MKMYCRSSAKYLAMGDVVGDVVESLRLGVESEKESFFSLSILLSIGERVWDVGVTESIAEGVIESLSLQECL